MLKRKPELVDMVFKNYEYNEHISKESIDEVIGCTFDAICDILIAGDDVEIVNFGIIGVKIRKGRNSHDLSTGKVRVGNDTAIPKIKPCTKLKVSVKEAYKKRCLQSAKKKETI